MSGARAIRAVPFVLLCALLCILQIGTAHAVIKGLAGGMPEAPMVDRDLKVTVTQPTAKLEVTMFMPPSGGPFPLVVVNHGASHDLRRTDPISDNFITYYFLSRGYAVVLPMMRGYADSEGTQIPFGCDVVGYGTRAAKDIRAVIDAVKSVPGVDATRIVVAGKSMGGWNTLAFGAQDTSDIKGLVSFAGGFKESDCKTPDQALIDGAAALGAHTRVPSIWFFGENDSIFSTPTWRAMFDRYKAAGAKAELVDIGSFQSDAHAAFASAAGLSSWVPALDRFLKRLGLPSGETYPGYLPKSGPDSTHYADLHDTEPIPYVDAYKRAVYTAFLSMPLPRAFAVGVSGAGASSGGFDASKNALDQCFRQTNYCQLYAVDNQIVWTGQEGAPPATRFAALTDLRAVPYLGEAGRTAYAKFLTQHRPRAFAIAPDGAWGSASGFDSMTQALLACGQGHEGCALYAVDGNVVWK